MTRPQLYYTASQITKNLYTAGKQYMTKDGKEYIGSYHKYYDGLILTLGDYSEVHSLQLYPYVPGINSSDAVLYNNLTKQTFDFISPYNTFPVPPLSDYKDGFTTRYILYRRNNPDEMYEINKSQFDLWKKPTSGIDNKLYNVVLLQWKLTGKLYDIKDSNGNIISHGVYDANKRLVDVTSRNLPSLLNFLTNYTELSIHSPLISQDIKAQFSS